MESSDSSHRSHWESSARVSQSLTLRTQISDHSRRRQLIAAALDNIGWLVIVAPFEVIGLNGEPDKKRGMALEHTLQCAFEISFVLADAMLSIMAPRPKDDRAAGRVIRARVMLN